MSLSIELELLLEGDFKRFQEISRDFKRFQEISGERKRKYSIDNHTNRKRFRVWNILIVAVLLYCLFLSHIHDKSKNPVFNKLG